MLTLPQILVVAGPTASGKTALAVKLAKYLNTQVISADSRQFYREIPIGSATPTTDETEGIPHHFIACRSIRDEYSAGQFGRDAREKIQNLLEKHPTVVVVGGSGLYVQSLLFGMDEFPDVSPEAKAQVESIFRSEGTVGLLNRLKASDPAYFREVDTQNPARLRRALEVIFSSGKTFSSFRTGRKTAHFTYAALGTDISKENLHRNIDRRVDKMIQNGLEDEARKVYPLKHLKSLQTVGYREFFEYFGGKLTLERCVSEIKTHTRQYAKRQATWFKKHLPYQKVNAALDAEEIINSLSI